MNFTSVFKNIQTLKFKSCLHNCIFRCFQSQKLLQAQATKIETPKHKTNWNPPVTNHKPWPLELIKVKFCFLKGLLRWFRATKTADRICMFLERAVNLYVQTEICYCRTIFLDDCLRLVFTSDRVGVVSGFVSRALMI